MTDAHIPTQRADRVEHPVLLVVVGTDRHRFDRLMSWLERWHASHRTPPDTKVQHGFSRPPELPGTIDFLDHATLQRAMSSATIVVSHGGPATITEARRHGHLPLVVPRDPAFAEHVDDHQQLFARRLAEAGMVRLCESETALAAALDQGLADPASYRIAADPVASAQRAEAVSRVGSIVESLERGPHRPPGRGARVPAPRRRS